MNLRFLPQTERFFRLQDQLLNAIHGHHWQTAL